MGLLTHQTTMENYRQECALAKQKFAGIGNNGYICTS
jgi:hypothetical protein